MTDLNSDIFSASDAKQLLDNPVWRKIWSAVNVAIDAKSLACDTAHDKDGAADIIRVKQLIRGLEREVQRVIDAGMIAEFRLDELEKKSQVKEFRR